VDDEKPLRLTDKEVEAYSDDANPFSASQISGIFGSSIPEQLNRIAVNGKNAEFFFSFQLVK